MRTKSAMLTYAPDTVVVSLGRLCDILPATAQIAQRHVMCGVWPVH